MSHLKKILCCVYLAAASVTYACKPCEDLLEYSIRNNSLIFIGNAKVTREAPPDILKRNLAKKSMWDHESYEIGVSVNVEENLGAALKNPKALSFETVSRYLPPCKDLSRPEKGKRYLFFPEDYGNCSKFLFEIVDGKVDGRSLDEIKSLIAKKKIP
jgi:hypothetical protein